MSATRTRAAWTAIAVAIAAGCQSARPDAVTARTTQPAAVGSLAPVDLRCMGLVDPQNVDVTSPTLSWRLKSDARGDRQTAYEVQAKWVGGDANDSATGRNGEATEIHPEKWAIRAGPVEWRVRVWDANGRPSAWSEPATFTVAPKTWSAKWIAEADDAATTRPVVRPMPLFRRDLRIDKPIARATAFVCGLGQFELRVNGAKVGDHELDPGWTDYKDTCLYVGLDITKHLKQGDNAVGVMLGNGFFNVPEHKGRYQKMKGSFGSPRLTAQLEIEYADGSHETIPTDERWRATPGPITFSSEYGGEDFDARRWPAGWDAAGFDASAWRAASVVDSPGGTLAGASRSAPPVRVAETFDGRLVGRPQPGAFVYDFGQNASSMPLIEVEGKAGAIVKLTPGESLDKSGAVSQKASGGPAWFIYTLAGTGGVETWSPRFTYYGSRWVQIEGAVPAGEPNPDGLPVVRAVRSKFVTSSSEPVGTFSCSNDLFTRAATIIRAAMRSNMQSLLTDCPHREKLGWLEQTHLVGPSLMYNFDAHALFAKVGHDMADAQTPEGLVPDIAPEYTTFGGGFRDSPEWGSAGVLIPWQTYEWYGDTQVLRDAYPMMKRYVDYLATKAKDDIVSHGLGDWYDIGPKAHGVAQLTPKAVTATAFYYRDLAILARVARLLGKPADAQRFDAWAARVRDAFNRAFYEAHMHSYSTGSQTANSIPLVFGLAPDADRAQVLDSLVADVRAHDDGLTSGDIGYRYLVRALADGGRSDVLFAMNSRSDRPGYGMILAKGATTLTEGWDGSASQNHFMLGHLMEWFYGDLAGISRAGDDVGWRKLLIHPTPVGDVTWASATYDSVRGRIASTWSIAGDRFTLDVTIPPGATAHFVLPGVRDATEGGVRLAEAKGVTNVQTTHGNVTCDVVSGTYRFAATRSLSPAQGERAGARGQ